MALNTFYDESYEMLRSQILDGTIKPGTRLHQGDIAEAFGLSRVPLREAIRKLEGERLVVVTPRRGVTIPELSDQDITDLYLIRIALEPAVFRRSTEAASEDQLEDLTVRTQRLGELVDDPAAFFDAHEQIVVATLEIAPGEVLSDVVTTTRERSRYLRYSYSRFPGRTQELWNKRIRVVEAMGTRMLDQVEHLTRLDLIESRDALLDWRAQPTKAND